MNGEQNGIGRHEHGAVMTVPDLPASMQNSDLSARRDHPPESKGCFASLCWCFSQPPAPTLNKESNQGQDRIPRKSSEPRPAMSDVQEAADEVPAVLNSAAEPQPQNSALPALESMDASSGELVIPDGNLSSLPDASRDKAARSNAEKGNAEKGNGESGEKDSSTDHANQSPKERGNSVESGNATRKTSPTPNLADNRAPSMDYAYSNSGSAAAGLEDVEMTGLQNDTNAGSRWAAGDLMGYVEIEDFNAERMSEGDTAVKTSPADPAAKVPPLPSIPARKRSPSPARASLPVSKTPMITPMGTPRYFSPQGSPRDSSEGESCKLFGPDGSPLDCRIIEQAVLQGIEAVAQCMLVNHWTSTDVGCLLTLKSAPGSAGVALDHAGLQLASRSGSEAATVMSARQCALFRRGLAQSLEHVNQRMGRLGVTIKRFQVLRDELSAANGMLGHNGELNRRSILQRYRHIVDDMYQHEGHYEHKWMTNLKDLSNPGPPAPKPVPDAQPAAPTGSGADARPWRQMGAEGHVPQRSSPGGKAAMVTPRERQAGEAPRQSEIVAYLSQMAEMRARKGEGEEGSGPPRSASNGGWTEARPPAGAKTTAGSAQSSPRFGLGQGSSVSPRLNTARSNSSQQRLPQSVRMLSVDAPGSGSNTPRDRGRYSPSFASGSVQPFTKAVNPSILPVGAGPLGLPVGGANFDGAFRACVTGPPATPVGKPPRPGGPNTAFSKRTEAASLEAIAGRPAIPRPMAFGGGVRTGGRADSAGGTGAGGCGGGGGGGGGEMMQISAEDYEVIPPPTGEWAF